MLLFYFGIASLIAVIVIVVSLMTYDYTKDPKTGEDIEDKIDDHLLKP